MKLWVGVVVECNEPPVLFAGKTRKSVETQILDTFDTWKDHGTCTFKDVTRDLDVILEIQKVEVV